MDCGAFQITLHGLTGIGTTNTKLTMTTKKTR